MVQISGLRWSLQVAPSETRGSYSTTSQRVNRYHQDVVVHIFLGWEKSVEVRGSYFGENRVIRQEDKDMKEQGLSKWVRKDSYRSSRVITGGALFFKISSSEWTPTTSSSPSCLAWSIAPAWPFYNTTEHISNTDGPRGGDHSPWWLKSKQPSTQSLSSDIATASCGSAGHFPSAGIAAPVSESTLSAGAAEDMLLNS